MANPVASVADAVANWQKGMSGAAEKYKAGITRTTVNPMALAATPQALQLYLDKVQQSVSSGRRAAALNAASQSDWKNNALSVGANRLSSGAQKAAPKYARNISKVAGTWQAIRDTVSSMPKGGLANAQARSNKAIEMMMQAAGTA